MKFAFIIIGLLFLNLSCTHYSPLKKSAYSEVRRVPASDGESCNALMANLFGNKFSFSFDDALNGSSLLIAFAVASHTDSLFLTLWCFFLMQALFVLIPKSIANPKASSSSTPNNEDDFQHSFQAAQAAIQQLSRQK